MPDHKPGGRHVAERTFQAATGGIRDIDPLAGLQAAGVQQLVQGQRLSCATATSGAITMLISVSTPISSRGV